MPSFTVESSGSGLNLTTGSESYGGNVRLTVRNGSTTTKTCRFRVVPLEGAQNDWFSIAGEPERTLEPNQSTQVELTATVPKTSPAGRRSVRVDAIETSDPDEDIARGPDLSFEVPKGDPVPIGFPWAIAIAAGVLVLVIAGGIGWWVWPRTVVVPDVKGQLLTDATSTLEGIGLEVSSTSRPERGTPENEVIDQDPVDGTEVDKGSEVALVVAEAIKTVKVPDLIGSAIDRALRDLDDLGLKSSVSDLETEDQPAGTIASQDPGPGTNVEPGTTIRLQVAVARASGPEIDEDCLTHDLGALEAREVNGRWKITQGNRWLLDFEGDAASARRALEVLRAYEADRICYVERPNAPMMYILNGDQPPSRQLSGEDCIGFNPASLEIRQEGDRFLLEGRSRMIMFPNRQSAQKAFAVIRKYGFRAQCFVGRPNPDFKYFRR